MADLGVDSLAATELVNQVPCTFFENIAGNETQLMAFRELCGKVGPQKGNQSFHGE